MGTRNAIQNLNNPKMERRSKCTIGFLETMQSFVLEQARKSGGRARLSFDKKVEYKL